MTVNTAKAISTVRRIPMLCISAAANGPIRPNRKMLMEIAAEIVAGLQPNARSSGTINTEGAARTPAVASMTRNITARTTQA